MAPNDDWMVRAFQRDLKARALWFIVSGCPTGAMELDVRFQKADINFLSAARRGSQNRAEKKPRQCADAHEPFLAVSCTTHEFQGIPTSECLARIISEGH